MVKYAKARIKWTEEMNAALRQARAEGKTIAQLCAMFSYSPSTISSQLFIIGATKTKDQSKIDTANAGPKTPELPKRVDRHTPFAPPPVGYRPPLLPPPKVCQWPLAGSKRFAVVFCGLLPVPGKSYCTEHYSIARRKESGNE